MRGRRTNLHDSHRHNGNCFEKSYNCHKCGKGELCDVCHKHEQPRGDCYECDPCFFCRSVEKDESRANLLKKLKDLKAILKGFHDELGQLESELEPKHG